MVKYHGIVHTVKVVKQLQLHLTRYLSGNPLHSNDLRIALTKKGLPKIFGSLLPLLLARDIATIRYILSICNYVRTLKGDGTLDTKSIESPSTCDPLMESKLIEFLNESDWFKGVINSFKPVLESNMWTIPHLSTKSGPNGQAMGSSLADLQAMPG